MGLEVLMMSSTERSWSGLGGFGLHCMGASCTYESRVEQHLCILHHILFAQTVTPYGTILISTQHLPATREGSLSQTTTKLFMTKGA
jgi:hypothetical protein